MMDYDAAGRQVRRSQVYNPCDLVWHDRATGGAIYVGNQDAAQGVVSNGSTLRRCADDMVAKGITHVVNCTDDMPNYCTVS